MKRTTSYVAPLPRQPTSRAETAITPKRRDVSRRGLLPTRATGTINKRVIDNYNIVQQHTQPRGLFPQEIDQDKIAQALADKERRPLDELLSALGKLTPAPRVPQNMLGNPINLPDYQGARERVLGNKVLNKLRNNTMI